MREPMPARLEIAFSRTKMDAVFEMVVSSGNSVGVAFPQPRVEGRSTSTLGIYIIRYSNAVSIAVSRRRYPQQDNGLEWVCGNNKIEYNAYG